MLYKIGDKVSHPGHGACIISDICECSFGNKGEQYYKLSSMVEYQTAIYVPVAKADQVGLRSLISEEEANVLLESLKRVKAVQIVDRTERQKKFETLFAHNTKDALLESLTALCNIVSKKKEKPLGSIEKNMLNTIQNKTLSEIALAKGISLDDAITQAEKIILS